MSETQKIYMSLGLKLLYYTILAKFSPKKCSLRFRKQGNILNVGLRDIYVYSLTYIDLNRHDPYHLSGSNGATLECVSIMLLQ